MIGWSVALGVGRLEGALRQLVSIEVAVWPTDATCSPSFRHLEPSLRLERMVLDANYHLLHALSPSHGF